MPDFLHIPGAPATYDFCDEIADSAVSVLTAQLSPLSIATIEVDYPQAGDRPRNYGGAELPAIYVYCENEDSEYVAGLTLNFAYRAHYGIAVWDGSPRAAREVHNRIRENVVGCLSSSYYQGSELFLPSGYQVWIDDFASGAVKHAERRAPFSVWSDNTFRVRVVVRDPSIT